MSQSRERLISRRQFGKDLILFLGTLALAKSIPVFAQDATPTPELPTPEETESAERIEADAQFETVPTLSQDFTMMEEGEALDPAVWTMEKGQFNSTLETNTDSPDNIRIEKDPVTGKNRLVIQAHKTENGWTSGRLSTKGKFDFTYGKIELTVQFPSAVNGRPEIPGAFAAGWNQSTDQSNSKNPDIVGDVKNKGYAANGEIDDIELQGGEPTIGYATAHTFNSVMAGGNPNGGKTIIEDATTAMHVYGMEWTPDKIVYTVRGVNEKVARIFHEVKRTSDDPKDWPFNHDFHQMINYAIGGKWAEQVAERNGWDLPNGVDDAAVDGSKFLIEKFEYFPMKQAA